MKNKVCQLVPAILLTSALVGCGGAPPAATKGTVTGNVTGRAEVTNFRLATFSSGQIVPSDNSTIVGFIEGSSGTLLAYPFATAPTVGTFNAGNYALVVSVAETTDTCQVTTLTNATANTSIFYSGTDTNNWKNLPVIPITLTGGDAIINITCNFLEV